MGMNVNAVNNGATNPLNETKKEVVNYNNMSADELCKRLAGKSNSSKKRHIRDDVKDELKKLYDNKEITEEKYEEAKKWNKKGNFVKEFFTGKKKDSTKIYNANIREDKLEAKKEEAKTQGLNIFSDKSKKILKKAGIENVEDFYKYAEEHRGSDYLYNYSAKHKQTGEVNSFKGDLRIGDDVSDKQVRQLLREGGYTVEKKYRPEALIRKGLIYGALAAPSCILDVDQLQDNKGLIATHQKQKVVVGKYITGAATIMGVLEAMHDEANRVENKAYDVREDLKYLENEKVATFDKFADHVDGTATEKNAKLLKSIGKHYVFNDKFDYKAFSNDAQTAAGKSGILNEEELMGWENGLINGKIKPQPTKVEEQRQAAPQPAAQQGTPAPTPCTVETYKDVDTVKDQTRCHTVQIGDNWTKVVMTRYGINYTDAKPIVDDLKAKYFEEHKDELIAKGIKSSKGAFFPKVGECLKLADIVKTASGKECKFQVDKNTVADKEVEKSNAVVMSSDAGNIFTKQKDAYYAYDKCADKLYKSYNESSLDSVKQGKYVVTGNKNLNELIAQKELVLKP